MPRKILHLDLDAFFCAVEERENPDLHGKAFAVGGQPDQRGVVSSCSYAARMFGVHSAMPMRRALILCPSLIVVSGHHHRYGDVSRQVMQHLYNRSNQVQQISIDEAFLDVSDLRPGGETIARDLQMSIWDDLHLPSSLGVATNKLVAKVANTVGKARKRTGEAPMAITIVPPGEEAAFLAPLPVRELWGIGPKTAASLAEYGITTIGDIARLPVKQLESWYGEHGRSLAMRARGIDDRPVHEDHETKSISHEITFAQDVDDFDKLQRTLNRLSENVGLRVRKAGVKSSTVKIKLRWADFTTLTRQITLPQPTDQDAVIFLAAQKLFNAAWTRGKRVRLIGVGVSSLDEPAQQLNLWELPDEKGNRLQDALDLVRDRYGRDAIRRALDIKGSPGNEEI